MGFDQVNHHISSADQARSDKDKMEHIIEALKVLAQAGKDLESKVRTLEVKR